MLKLKIKNCPELIYTSKIIFIEFLGLDISIEADDNIVEAELLLDGNKKIIFEDHFFSDFNFGKGYLCKESVPEKVEWLSSEFSDDSVPVIFGIPEITKKESKVVCKVDFFASAFFMLSRWEEAVSDKKDSHCRFPAEESLAYKEGFLKKPVVNQYVETIWNILIYLGYDGKRKERSFSIEVSHDVDAPFKYADMSIKKIIRLIGGDLIKRKSLSKAVVNFCNYLSVKAGILKKDPFNSFNFIMDVSESFNMKSTFYFISGKTNMQYDGNYTIDDKKIIALLQNIDIRGHRIGLHGSYNSYNSNAIEKELKLLSDICSENGIKQQIIYSRQHFLRWAVPDTFQELDNAGIEYDSTLTYAASPGFRTGSCYHHSVFNVKTRNELNVKEIPLVVMDATLLAERYLGLSCNDAKNLAVSLKNECKKYNGIFSLLWHNNEFNSKEKINLYKHILSG